MFAIAKSFLPDLVEKSVNPRYSESRSCSSLSAASCEKTFGGGAPAPVSGASQLRLLQKKAPRSLNFREHFSIP